MKLALGFVLLVSLLSAAENTAKPTVDDLGWLAGRWQLEKNGRLVQEEWMSPAGGTMLGMSRTVKSGRTIEYEFLVLRADESGDIFYIATPSAQPKAEFKLVQLAEKSVVFENKAHDFPQRIGYALNADRSLLAYIEGERDGKTKRIEYPYQPAK
ncbi:MAG: hypothetical protein KA257_12055 [Opitutaceae bacterium]|nr:hypothetical protein [Opitutaceae bacterium]MBP9913552.1 hypothetical protein [Opitutaceae bacterium]